jgi:putrescine transport system substrate-binding protein
MTPMRRLSLCVFALAALIAGADPLAAQAKKERIVNIYNWSDYIDPAVIEDFTRQTGIKVRYDTFDSNDTAHRQIRLRRCRADRVFPGAADQGRRVPEARQEQAYEYRQCLAGNRRAPCDL